MHPLPEEVKNLIESAADGSEIDLGLESDLGPDGLRRFAQLARKLEGDGQRELAEARVLGLLDGYRRLDSVANP